MLHDYIKGRIKKSGVESYIKLNTAVRWISYSRHCARRHRHVEIGKLDGHQKRLKATFARFPAYDPEKTRVRA